MPLNAATEAARLSTAPMNAATEAARLSTAPMMDGSDFNMISVSCGVPCAAYVHVSIAYDRTMSWKSR